MNHNILIVEDDEDLRNCLRDIFSTDGYIVQTLKDGAQVLPRIKKSQPDVVLLDRGLPSVAGDTICQEIKRHYPETIVILLTGKDQTRDIVDGLAFGADDYITKPFSVDELLARVKARLRQQMPSDSLYTVEDLAINTKTMEVKRQGNQIPLSSQAFKILTYLMANEGRVVSREMILSRLWQRNPDVETRVVDVYIGYLRKKIDAGYKTKLIQSVRGFGYKIAGSYQVSYTG